MMTLINGDDFITYNTLDMAMATKVLREISNQAKAIDGGECYCYYSSESGFF